MELLQLKYFLELAKREHLSKTAEAMMVSPPAISSSLARLEQELGVNLFDRVGRNIRLNDNGREYAKYVNRAFDALSEGALALQETSSTSQNVISVCAVNPYLWNNPLQDFHAKYPEISVKITALDTGNDFSTMPKSPELTSIDFYLAGKDTISADNMERALIVNARVLLAVSPANKLSKRKTISLAEAKDEWFINSPHNTVFRKYCDDLCLEAGFSPKSILECDYMLRPRLLISENMVAIATSLGKQSELYNGTKTIPIVKPKCSRPFYIYWKKDRVLSDSGLKFKDFMIDYGKNNYEWAD